MMRFCLPMIPCLLLTELAAAGLSEVYVLGDSYKLNREGTRIFSADDLPLDALKRKSLIWDAATRTVSLAGARRETVAFQLVLHAGPAGAADVDVKLSALAGPGGGRIGPEHIALFKVWYTQVQRPSSENCAPSTGPGWYPDALVPWDARSHGAYVAPPFPVDKSTCQSVWVDVDVPADAAPGQYQGTITVLESATPAHTLTLRLRVRNFELPRQIHNLLFMNGAASDVWMAGGYWLKDQPQKKARYEQELFRIARRHRFTLGNMYYEGYHDKPSVLPTINADAEGNIVDVDWSQYDARWGPLLSARDNLFGPGEPPIEIWRLPVGTGITKKRFPENDRTFEQFPKWIVKHWKEKGWDLDAAYVYLADEPRIDQLPALADTARKIAAATDPPLHMQIAILAQKDPDKITAAFHQHFGGLLDRWLWSANSLDPAALRKTLRPADWIGFYQGNEPYCPVHVLDKDALALRLWPWIAWQYGIRYSCYYSITECAVMTREDGGQFDPTPDLIWTNPTNRPNGNQSKAVCFYPGTFVGADLPIGNIRLKQVRRGQQDYEYMWLLARAGRQDQVHADVRGLLRKALSEAADRPNQIGHRAAWDADPAHWDAQVARWGDAIEKAPGK